MKVRGTVYSLDLENQTDGWKTGPNQMPIPRGGLRGAAVDGIIYTFDGEDNPNSVSGVFHNSEAYNSKTQQWTELPPMELPRHGNHAAAVDRKIYIPGGGLQQDGKAINRNETAACADSSPVLDAYCV